MEEKAIEKLLSVIEDGIGEIAEKAGRTNRIDPNEIDILKKALCVKAMLEEEMGGGQSSYRGRSHDGGSYQRGRNQNNGQYMSREGSYGGSYGGTFGGSHDGGMSGHSASDRLIAMIEDFGNRGSDAERQAAEKFLRQMR